MRSSRFEFFTLLAFLVIAALVLTNGFSERIFAKDNKVDTFESVEPIADVLTEILRSYVREPDVNKVVEGALAGMMSSLDKHSSYVPAEMLKELTSDTEGQFDGIGVVIGPDEDKNIVIEQQPIPGSPAAKAGLLAGDIIVKIDQVDTKGMTTSDVAQRIKGPRGSVVHLTLYRKTEGSTAETPLVEVDVKRDTIPLESITEARVLDGGIGYIRVKDFKKTTARDLDEKLKELQKQGMKSLILDLRWNPGGLLSASKEACELFLPKNTLVTYTKGRGQGVKGQSDDLNLYTERTPVVPSDFPLVVLVNEFTASSSEIVTGALQYWQRAIIVGQKSYGKGSVQTVIPLRRPSGAALRLTTALYYTPAKVTIDNEGIKPDVEVPVDNKTEVALYKQLSKSIIESPEKKNAQNHGPVTGNEAKDGTVEDTQLKRAVDIIKEDGVFEHLVAKYHKDTHETQTAAAENSVDQVGKLHGRSAAAPPDADDAGAKPKKGHAPKDQVEDKKEGSK
ncbi:MAG: S41 family peptidase [Candidatus Hydrogenedentes bacterium]|nr:S41 family peptidase [Candidatus Hydrogenedentota bacterium]